MNIIIDQININFQVYGNGSPLIVLHGWGDSINNWYSFAQRLSSNCQVILIDLPGFGHSENLKPGVGVKAYRDIILKFIDELKIEKPYNILGHSFGGKIACHLSINSNNCRRLILVSASGVDSQSVMTKIKILIFKTMRLLLFPLGDKKKIVLKYIQNRLGSQDYQHAGKMLPTLLRVVNQKVFALLPRIKVPTLIVWGSNDKTLNMKQSKIFERLIPDSYIRILWGASHFPHIDVPGDLADIILDFFEKK